MLSVNEREMFDNNPVVQVIMVHIRLHNSKLVLK